MCLAGYWVNLDHQVESLDKEGRSAALPGRDRDAIAKALDALEAARATPRGPERARALKEAGRLRCIADLQGVVVARRGRPPKAVRNSE
jgi:hypothetical protein